MDILMIGGTRFIGRHLVVELLNRGHHVTLFHRGKTNPGIFPTVDRIIGDRKNDLEQLGDRTWDIVIDTCGYKPEHVELSVAYLNGKCHRYVFISSAAVYEPTAQRGIDESAPLQTEPPTADEVEWWHTQYARDKVRCERIVLNRFGHSNALIIRPGMVIGPYDPNGYFTYWPLRMRQGGKIIAPAIHEQPLQFIDARDLAEFTVEMVDRGIADVFTVDGPEEPLTYASFLMKLQSLFENDAEIHWIEEEWLLDRELERPWEKLPYWLPGDAAQGYCCMSNEKAIRHGLTFRPVERSAIDVLDWYDREIAEESGAGVESLPTDRGLRPAEERELLKAYLGI